MKIKAQLVLCLMFEFARTQFTSSRRLRKTPCEIRGTALVEQFFNVIFAEFQHSPPTCICVQMCADQPTYCYPNGCFKKANRKKETSPVSSIQQDAKTVFLVDNDRNVMADLMGNVNLMSSSVAGNADKSQPPWESNLIGRNNPFKEIVFKYKRLPKLQMKYNLREQIKHTRDKKAEVDLSKTRWPTNKQINRQINHQKTSNYLTSVVPETNQRETPKYFKRYLTKRENQVDLDISALYLYKDASNFSLETLIDNLIERGLEDTNRTSIFKSNHLSKSEDGEVNDDIKLTNSEVLDSQNDTKKITIEVTLKTNATGNDRDRHRDSSNHTNTSTAAYFDMMTTMSKQIDKQNNISMQVMGHFAGEIATDVNAEEPVNIVENLSKTKVGIKTDLKVTEESKPTTDTIPTSLLSVPVINNQVTKSKQRIVRKLRNRKLN